MRIKISSVMEFQSQKQSLAGHVVLHSFNVRESSEQGKQDCLNHRDRVNQAKNLHCTVSFIQFTMQCTSLHFHLDTMLVPKGRIHFSTTVHFSEDEIDSHLSQKTGRMYFSKPSPQAAFDSVLQYNCTMYVALIYIPQ